MVNRFHEICDKALAYDVPILIDAEESWMQDAADMLVEELMEKYNTEKAIVFNTLQMYRHDRMNYLRKLHHNADQKKVSYWIKNCTWCLHGKRKR